MRPSVSRELPCSVATAWSILVDLDAWPTWGPTVAGASVSTGALREGAHGTVRTVVGVSLPFTVTAFEQERGWAWSVAGVPATTHHVRPTPGGCVVTFTVPWWAPAYLPICALALRRIERLATEN